MVFLHPSSWTPAVYILLRIVASCCVVRPDNTKWDSDIVPVCDHLGGTFASDTHRHTQSGLLHKEVMFSNAATLLI